MLPAKPYRALNCLCLSACGQRRRTSGWRRLWISPKPHTLPAASLIGAAGFSLVGLVALGRDFEMDYRWAEGHLDRLPMLAEEFVRLKPDLILASIVPAAVASRDITKTIPIVCPVARRSHALGSDQERRAARW